jgi:hypothetical protein
LPKLVGWKNCQRIRNASLIFKKLPIENNRPFGENFYKSGTDVMILKIFSPKNFAKKLAFLTQNKAKL